MERPVLVYDDDCGFCTWWAELFDRHADLKVVGFEDVDTGLADRLPAEYEHCSHVVTDDGVYSCGSSLEEALLHTAVGPVFRPIVATLRRFKPYRDVREWGYRHVADNRAVFGRLLSRPPPARDDRN